MTNAKGCNQIVMEICLITGLFYGIIMVEKYLNFL